MAGEKDKLIKTDSQKQYGATDQRQEVYSYHQLLTPPNGDKHPLISSLKAHNAGPFVWSPGEAKAHKMQRGIISSIAQGAAAAIGQNIPVGHRGISYDNGKLVILGEGNHTMLSPNHKYKGTVSLACPANGNPIIDIEGQASIVFVEPGDIAVLTNGASYLKLAAGKHVVDGQSWRYLKAVKANAQLLDLGDLTVVRVPDGKIGFARHNNGDLIKLEKGEHIISKADCQFLLYKDGQPFADLGEKYIEVSPYERIRVEGNEVGVISDANGLFTILDKGIHEITDGRVNFKDYIPLSNIGLHINPEHHFRTKDGADVRVTFDINFKIYEPDEAINALCNPEECTKKGDMQKLINAWVKERAIDAMAALVSQHNTNDIIIVPDGKADIKDTGQSLQKDIREHFIEIINKSLRDKGLALDSFRLGSGLEIISPEANERLNAQVGAAAQANITKAQQESLNIQQAAENQRKLASVDVDNEVKRREVEAEIARKNSLNDAKVAQKQKKYEMLKNTLGSEGITAFLLAKQHRKATQSLGQNAQTLVVGSDAGQLLQLGGGPK